MRKLDNFKIILCSKSEQAEELNPDVTIEAEYGDVCVEGSKLTLAHHGERSSNPAPCNTDVTPLESGIIVISHMDLDTIGGIMAVVGEKIEDDEFWKATEVIDVMGPHHIYKFSQDIQNKFNAFYAWQDTHDGKANTEPIEVTDKVQSNFDILHKILDDDNLEHEDVIVKGKEWKNKETDAIESRLITEDEYVRAFITDGIFCAGSYYSPKRDTIIPCTVSYNTIYCNVTVAFEDGGLNGKSARNIVQKLWGPEAGGRDGIAGSPRGTKMYQKDFNDAISAVRLNYLASEFALNIADYFKIGIYVFPNLDTIEAVEITMTEKLKNVGCPASAEIILKDDMIVGVHIHSELDNRFDSVYDTEKITINEMKQKCKI